MNILVAIFGKPLQVSNSTMKVTGAMASTERVVVGTSGGLAAGGLTFRWLRVKVIITSGRCRDYCVEN